MRALFVLLVLVALTSYSVTGLPVSQDPDDAALMEIGIDLANRVEPAPTYVTERPLGHEDTVIAKFPLLHEMKGLEAAEWTDIQGLLFREPSIAAESNVDMKLDELEAKFNKIDKMPIPSSIAPKGSTLLPSLIKPEIGLRATLPLNIPRMKQLKGKTAAASKVAVKKAAPAAAKPAKSAKAVVRAAPAAPPATTVPAKAPAAAPPAAKPAAPAAPAAAAAKPAAKVDPTDAKKAEEAATAKAAARVSATVTTVRLIEKRLKGLNNLVNRLKGQLGITVKDKVSSAQRLTAALSKHRKEKKDLAKRMANRKARFAQVDLDSDAQVEAEADAEVLAAEQSLAETDIAVETDADAEAELNADAEAVDEILESLM